MHVFECTNCGALYRRVSAPKSCGSCDSPTEKKPYFDRHPDPFE